MLIPSHIYPINMNNVFVTGPPRSGKSTMVKVLMDELNLGDFGILTPEIRRDGKRCGFKIVDLSTGEEGVLAHVDNKGGPRVGHYGLNLGELDRITEQALLEIPEGYPMAVIDEIGTMELHSKLFESAVIRLLESHIPVLTVLHRNYVERYGKYGTVLTLDKDYDQIKRRLAVILKDMSREPPKTL